MPTIDKRIVEMQFNNKQFEQGVAESLKSLARLNDALELDQHLDSIERLKNTMDHLDFNQLNKAAENINRSFTIVGKVINDTKQKIADFIKKELKQVGEAVPAAFGFKDISVNIPFMEGPGFNKYAKKTKAVQTIMSATGKSVEEVNAVLKDLMDYTDMTSYDFTEMVASIGKFTSVGQDLKKSEKAMEGIANWAAISGADKNAANHVMYNLSQAMGAGVVKMMDWRSVMNMNMATKEFKEEVINAAIAAGTLQKKSDGVGKIMKQTKKATKTTAAEFKEIEVNYKNFDQALSEGFFTSDVLMSVLEKYADTSNDLGKKAYEAAKVALTFSDAVDAINDALSSGWSRTFEALFGNVEEAGKTWTGLCDAIIEFVQIFSDYRNNILESWHEMGGFNDMLKAAGNLWQTFMNIVDKVGESIHKVFPMLESNSVTKMLVDATKSLKDLTAGWLELSGGKRDTEEETEEIEKQTTATKKNTQANKDNAASLLTVERTISQGLKRGARGEQVREMQEVLLKAGMKLDKYGADGIFGPETQAALKNLQKKLGVEQTGVWDKATNDAAKRAGYLQKTVSNTAKIVNMDISKIQEGLKRGMRGDKVKEMQKQLMAAGYKLDKYGADGIFGPETQAALKKLQKDLGVKQTGVWDKATQNAINNAKKMKKAQQENAKAQKKAADASKNKKAVDETKKDAKETNDIFTRLQNIVTGILSAVKIAGGAIAGVGYFVKKLVGLVGLLVDPIVSILSALGLMVTSFEETLSKDGTLGLLFDTIDQMFAPLEKGIKAFADTISRFFGKNKDIKTFADLWAAIKKEVSENEVWTGIINVFEKIGSTAGKLIGIARNLAGGFMYLVSAKVMTAFNWIVENLPGAILIISNTLSDLVNAIVNSEFVKTVISDIVSAFSGVIGFIGRAGSAIKDFFGKNKDIKNFGDLWKALNKELSKHKGWKAFSKVLKKVGDLFGKVRTKFKGFYDTAKKNIGEGLKKAFSWILNDFPGIILKVVEFGEKMVDAVKNSETLKKAWKGISGFFKTTFTVIKSLAEDLLGTIKKFFFGGEDSVEGPFERLQGRIDGIKEKISKFGETVSGKLKEIYDNSEFIRNLYDNYLKPFWTKITTFATLLKDGIVGFFTTDTSDVEGFGNKLKKRLKAFEPLVEFITGIGEDVREAIKSLISSFSFENLWMTIIDGFNIFGSAKAEGGSGSIYYTEEETGSGGVFDRIIENVKKLLDKVSGIDIGSFVSEKLESVGMDGPKLAKFIMSSLGYIALFKVAKGIAGIGKGFKFGGKGLLEFGTGFKDLGKDIGGAFKSFSSTVGGSIKDFLLGSDGKGSLGDMVVNFTKEMAKAKNQRPKDSLGTTFLKLSTSLLIVAGAIALISTIKPEQLEKNIGIFIGVVAGLGTMVGLLGLEGDNIEKLGHGILSMAGALGVLVLAIEGMALVVQHNDAATLTAALGTISGMLWQLGIIEFIIAKAGGIGGDKNVINVKLPSILSMCVGVGILVLAVAKMVKIIENTGANTFEKAFKSITDMVWQLGIIEIALAALGRNKGSGSINVKLPSILTMCAGIYVLVHSVGKMIKLIDSAGITKFDKAYKSITDLIWQLGAIEIVIAALGRNKSGGINVKISGILSMCAGIMLLTFAVDRVVKGMERSSKYEAAFDLISGMVWQLGIIEAGLSILNQGGGFKIGGILGMCAGIALLIYAVCNLADVYDTYERTTDNGQKFNRLEQAFDLVEGFMLKLGITTSLMAGAITKMALVPIPVAAKAAVGLVTFGAIVVGAIAGLAALLGGINDVIKEITDGFDLGEWLGEKMAAFGNGIGRFIGGIIVGIQRPFENGEDVETKSLAENIEDLGASLSKALDSFMPLLDKVQGISQTHVTGLTNFAQCLLAMTGADLVDSIAAFIGGKKGEGETGSAFVDFAYQLVALCAPLTELGPAAKDIKNDELLKLVPVMETMKTLAESVTAIGWEDLKQDVMAALPFGDDHGGLSSMIVEMGSLVENTSGLTKNIAENSIDIDALNSMIPVFTSLKSIATTITGIKWEQTKQKVLGVILGEDGLVSFAKELTDAAPDLLSFAVYSDSISQYATGIEGTSVALTAIANAADAVPKTGGALQKLMGESHLDTFGTQLGTLGWGLKNFYNETKGIEEGYDPSGVTTALQTIIDVAENVPKVGGAVQNLFGASDAGKFGEQLGGLGQGLADFASKTNSEKLDPVGMQSAAATLLMLAQAFSALPTYVNDKWMDDESLNSPIHIFNTILNSLYQLDFEEFSDIGNSMLHSITNGFYKDVETGEEPLDGPFRKMLKSGNKTIRSYYEVFKSAGAYLIEGVIVGINSKQTDLTNAIRTSIQAGIKTATETLDEHSPSKVGIWLGKYWDLGIAQGVLNYGKSISNAIEGTLTDGFETAKTTWDEHSNSKKGIWLGEYWDGGVIEGIFNKASGVSDAMSSVFGDGVDVVKDIFGDNADIDSILNNFMSMTTEDFDKLPDKLKSKYEELLGVISGEGTNLADGITSLDDHLTEATDGFGQGMITNIDKLKQALANVDLKLGSKGKGVDALVQLLINEGYLSGNASNYTVFGPKVEDALKKYQKDLGVKETGVWDKNTSNAMQKVESAATKTEDSMSLFDKWLSGSSSSDTKKEDTTETNSILDQWLSDSQSFYDKQEKEYERVTGVSQTKSQKQEKDYDKDSFSEFQAKMDKKTNLFKVFKDRSDMESWAKEFSKTNDKYFTNRSEWEQWIGRKAIEKAGNTREGNALAQTLKTYYHDHLVTPERYKQISESWYKKNITPGEHYFKSLESLESWAEKQAKLQSDDANVIDSIKQNLIDANKNNVLGSENWDKATLARTGSSPEYNKFKRDVADKTAKQKQQEHNRIYKNFEEAAQDALDTANKLYPTDTAARDKAFDLFAKLNQKLIKRPGYDYGQKSSFRNENELQQWAWHYANEALKNGVINPDEQAKYAEDLIKANMSKVVAAVKQAANDKLIVEPEIRPVIDATNATVKGGNVVQKDIPGLNPGGQTQSLAQKVFDTFNPGVSAAKASEIGINDVKNNMSTLDQNLKTRDEQYYKGLKDLTDTMGVKLSDLAKMSVYIDGRTLLGYLTPKLDRSMGNATVLAGRMN